MHMRKRQHGVTITELIVACTLLSSLMAVVVPSFIRIGQLNRSMRHHRVAMDELSNQLDNLQRLSLGAVESTIDDLTPSKFARQSLSDLQLAGQLSPSELGHRISLTAEWGTVGGQHRSLRLCTWVFREDEE